MTYEMAKRQMQIEADLRTALAHLAREALAARKVIWLWLRGGRGRW